MEEVGGRKVVKERFFMLILDGLHRREAMCELRVEGVYAWTEKMLHMQQIMRRVGE